MVNEKLDPDVMDTLKSIKEVNDRREKAAKSLKTIAEIKRELGQPDPDLEQFTQKTQFNVDRTKEVLKKRGL